MDAATGRRLLRYLREERFTVQADGDRLLVSPASQLGDGIREHLKKMKSELLHELRREAVEQLLDAVAVDPETGLPDLPSDEPATVRQAERLRELAAHPAFGDKRPKVQEIVEEALDSGLSQLGAYGLLGELGRRISQRSGD